MSSLPDDIRPGPDLYGLPWEAVVFTGFFGLFTLLLFSCRFIHSVSSALLLHKKFTFYECYHFTKWAFSVLFCRSEVDYMQVSVFPYFICFKSILIICFNWSPLSALNWSYLLICLQVKRSKWRRKWLNCLMKNAKCWRHSVKLNRRWEILLYSLNTKYTFILV